MRLVARHPGAQLRRRRVLAPLSVVTALWGALCLLAAGSVWAGSEDGASASLAVNLEGTWYVLVHYRDEASPHPEAVQWEDRIWRFERKGSHLSWSEFPRVTFADPSGREEKLAGERTGRTLGAWEPNATQLEEIRRGLEIDGRGARAKSLRGSESRGYRSAGALRSQSASVIGYHESWRIDGMPHRPIFERHDVMGSGRTENMQGRTRYATHRVLDGGDELRGEYDRDGAQRGTFRMLRTGESPR